MVNKHPLPGSERTVEPGSKVVGQCDPAQPIEVFVMLRRQQQAQFDALISRIEAGDPNVKPLSREALAKEYGASPDDVAKVKAFAAAHGLTVVHEDLAARSGTVLAEGTERLALIPYTAGDDQLRAALAGFDTVVVYKGGRHLPAVLDAVGEDAVYGEELGRPGETLTPPDGAAPYFSTVIRPAARDGRGSRL